MNFNILVGLKSDFVGESEVNREVLCLKFERTPKEKKIFLQSTRKYELFQKLGGGGGRWKEGEEKKGQSGFPL